MTITLTGFMGCGKSSTGRKLAEILGWEFIDLDTYIEHKIGQNIPEIFADSEQRFRAIEAEAVRDVVTMKEITGGNLVLALGGGTFCNAVVRDFLLSRTETVWLAATEKTLEGRLAAGTGERPMLQNTDWKALLSERTAYYQLAEKHIDTDNLTPEEAAIIISKWNR